MARSKATTAMRGVATEFEKQVDQEIAVAAQHEVATERVRSVPVVEEEVEVAPAPEPERREICLCCVGCIPVEKRGGEWYYGDSHKARVNNLVGSRVLRNHREEFGLD